MAHFPVTRVVVADTARARIFELSAANRPLDEISDLTNPEARLKDGDLDSDRPGRSFDSMGYQSGHPLRPNRTAQEKSADAFAGSIAERLKSALSEGAFERLVIAAPPGFLGVLRHRLDLQVVKTISGSHSLDLTRESSDTIRDRLCPEYRKVQSA